MDYIFLSALKGIEVEQLWISYDIACQWCLNLFTRMKSMPKDLRLPDDLITNFLIPKFHLPAHVKECHALFAYNFALGIGRGEGEGIERAWAWLNEFARSLSVMGAGSRSDTLDDIMNYFNWMKVVKLGEYKAVQLFLYSFFN